VLVIDDDANTLLEYKGILRAAGHDVTTAALGEDGLTAAQRSHFDVVLCDHCFRDTSGINVIRAISEQCPGTRIVFVTACATPELVVTAKRSGATACADKPLAGDDLLKVVEDTLRLESTGEIDRPEHSGYAARRWADLVVRGALLDTDPKTIPRWSRNIGCALGTLKRRCHAVGVTPKASLDLLRFLQIVLRHPGEEWDLQSRLDIVDDRTAAALLERAGLNVDCPDVLDLDAFLGCQRFIVRPELSHALRQCMSRLRSH
jgi:DNA-binding response OmpR family regulator